MKYFASADESLVMKRILGHLAVLLVFAGVHGSAALALGQLPEARYEPAQLREDFSLLRSALQDGHIGLYRYAGRQEVDAVFDATFSTLGAPLTETEFLARIARLLALIRDDHTFALPSQRFWDANFSTSGTPEQTASRLRVLPFFVRVAGDRLFLTHDNSSERALPAGSEILQINGKKNADILKILDRHLPTSGRSDAFRRRSLDHFNIMQEYNRLCISYALYVEAPASFELLIRRPAAASEETVRVAGLSYAEVMRNFRQRYESTNDPLFAQARPISLSFPEQKAALLSLPSFHDWQWNRQGLKYQAEIGSAFRTILEKQINHLIIDLRGNEGGSAGIGIEVLSHLATAPFQVYVQKEMLGYRFPKYEKYMRQPRSLDNLTDSLFEKTAAGTYRVNAALPNETWSRPMVPAADRYSGNLYVLIDGATGSAAAQCATIIRVNRRDAVFVGEESGGDMDGPVSNSYLDLQLPNSGIRVDIPLMKKVMHLNGYPHESGRGVIPNHAVVWSADDIAQRRDPVLGFTLGLIAKNGTPRQQR